MVSFAVVAVSAVSLSAVVAAVQKLETPVHWFLLEPVPAAVVVAAAVAVAAAVQKLEAPQVHCLLLFPVAELPPVH